MPERVVITGGTGFLGSFVVPALRREYPEVVCVVRSTSQVDGMRALDVELRTADLGDEAGLERAFRGAATLVNLASIGFGHAPGIVRAARAAGVERAVFIGTTAVFTSLPARTRRTRLEAEQWVRNSGLRYSLLRPTMIYGAPRDRNMARLIGFLLRYPVLPVPGSGRTLQQPVLVDDVASAVLSALRGSESEGKSYNLAGPRPIAFNDLVDATARALGRRVLRLHVPLAPLASAARVAALAGVRTGVSAEQVYRLGEDKVFDISPARRDLGFDPRSFEAGIRLEIERFGLARPAVSPAPLAAADSGSRGD